MEAVRLKVLRRALPLETFGRGHKERFLAANHATNQINDKYSCRRAGDSSWRQISELSPGPRSAPAGGVLILKSE